MKIPLMVMTLLSGMLLGWSLLYFVLVP